MFVVLRISLTQVMRKFSRQLDDWLKTALEDTPLALQQTKIDRQYFCWTSNLLSCYYTD